ncbi:hypothetical protein [Streptomyces zaomyceticus]|uniref:hypothetical protein n=1 Tax=Streptomyces zaomyceticus TaxID=68286 RepID=UPI0036766198
MRLIGDHSRRPKETRRSWQGCDLDLTGVVINGSMDFSGAEFSGGMVEFGDATFSGGAVFFGRMVFSSSPVTFSHAVFADSLVFFGNSVYSGGTVDFSCATGPVPAGLLRSVGSPAPATVYLSDAWVSPVP